MSTPQSVARMFPQKREHCLPFSYPVRDEANVLAHAINTAFTALCFPSALSTTRLLRMRAHEEVLSAPPCPEDEPPFPCSSFAVAPCDACSMGPL